jgi:hypothetical protein
VQRPPEWESNFLESSHHPRPSAGVRIGKALSRNKGMPAAGCDPRQRAKVPPWPVPRYPGRGEGPANSYAEFRPCFTAKDPRHLIGFAFAFAGWETFRAL